MGRVDAFAAGAGMMCSRDAARRLIEWNRSIRPMQCIGKTPDSEKFFTAFAE
jgi:hypothetical protein